MVTLIYRVFWTRGGSPELTRRPRSRGSGSSGDPHAEFHIVVVVFLFLSQYVNSLQNVKRYSCQLYNNAKSITKSPEGLFPLWPCVFNSLRHIKTHNTIQDIIDRSSKSTFTDILSFCLGFL